MREDEIEADEMILALMGGTYGGALYANMSSIYMIT